VAAIVWLAVSDQTVDPRLPPGPQGLPRQYVQAHQRERLMNAMVTAVDANGYMATSVADVLALARVSRTTFYEMFRDKEDCFLACYDRGTTKLFEVTAASMAQGGPWKARVRRSVGALLRTFAEYPQLARMCMVEALAAGQTAQARYQQAVTGFVSIIETDMLSNDQVPKVSRTVIQGIVGGISSIIYQYIVAGRTRELPEMLDDVLAFYFAVFEGYRQTDGDRVEGGAESR
jgi:AcrR family transcriptional regulator